METFIRGLFGVAPDASRHASLGERLADRRREQRLRVVFDNLDSAGKGFLNRDDLQSTSHPDEVIALLDADSDLRITFPEFYSAFRNAPMTSLISRDALAIVNEFGTRISSPIVGVGDVGYAFPTTKLDSRTELSWYLQTCVATEVITRSIMAPIERVRIDAQVNGPRGGLISPWSFLRGIYIEHGITAVYQGHGANLLRVIPSSLTSCTVIVALLNKCDDPYDIWNRAAIGGVAGLTATLLWRPLDVIRTRMTLMEAGKREYTGIIDCARKLAAQNGLYQGTVPALASVVPFFVSYQAIFAAMKRTTNPYFDCQYYVSQIMLCAAVAGVSAVAMSHPFEVIQRSMSMATSNERPMGSMRASMRATYAESGIRGFYSGLGLSVFKTIPSIFIATLLREEYISYLKRYHHAI